MLGVDALWAMAQLLLFTAPLVLVWLVALGVGARMLASARSAGLCLMAAAALELVRLALGVLLVPLPVVLMGSGTLGSEGLRWFALGRGVFTVAAVLVSHSLLLLAIFGWRGKVDGLGPEAPPA
jgi:hypothetical protein